MPVACLYPVIFRSTLIQKKKRIKEEEEEEELVKKRKRMKIKCQSCSNEWPNFHPNAINCLPNFFFKVRFTYIFYNVTQKSPPKNQN